MGDPVNPIIRSRRYHVLFSRLPGLKKRLVHLIAPAAFVGESNNNLRLMWCPGKQDRRRYLLDSSFLDVVHLFNRLWGLRMTCLAQFLAVAALVAELGIWFQPYLG